jgi:hypothetical protein
MGEDWQEHVNHGVNSMLKHKTQPTEKGLPEDSFNEGKSASEYVTGKDANDNQDLRTTSSSTQHSSDNVDNAPINQEVHCATTPPINNDASNVNVFSYKKIVSEKQGTTFPNMHEQVSMHEQGEAQAGPKAPQVTSPVPESKTRTKRLNDQTFKDALSRVKVGNVAMNTCVSTHDKREVTPETLSTRPRSASEENRQEVSKGMPNVSPLYGTEHTGTAASLPTDTDHTAMDTHVSRVATPAKNAREHVSVQELDHEKKKGEFLVNHNRNFKGLGNIPVLGSTDTND